MRGAQRRDAKMRGAKARRKDERRKGETQRRKKKKKKKKKKVRELDALLPLKGLCASIMFRPLLDGARNRTRDQRIQRERVFPLS